MTCPRRLLGATLAVALLGCGGSHRSPVSGGSGEPLPVTSTRPVIQKGVPETQVTPAPLVATLAAELDRNFSLLGKEKPSPYFMAYEAIDEDALEVIGSSGALLHSERNRSRSLDVDVRVGSETLDNTHPIRGDADAMRELTRTEWLPLDDDPLAVESVAWIATRAEYERALSDYLRVKADQNIKVEALDTSADFTREAAHSFIGPVAELHVDAPALEARVRKWSEPFRDKDILASSVSVVASAETRTIVTSDGSRIQVPRTHARIEMTATTVAADGMRLERTETVDAPEVARLPSDSAILALVTRIKADLAALRAAPVIEPYVGPAILDGRAAAVFFHEIFGHRVEGHRQKNEEEGQTFSHKVGESVMPGFLDVVDDPTAASLDGTPLAGYYELDDEGVAATRTPLVERGVLRGFLMSRSPLNGFAHSNGHGRRERGHRIVARQGNLLVLPERTTTLAALEARLLSEVKRSGRPYGLRFHEITGGYTNTTRGAAQAFKVLPVMVYRVYPDGREELVRGADLEGTPLSSLSRIDAAADDFQIFNGVCGAESGWVPVSATSPSLLVNQIEVARREKSTQRPPLLPAPNLRDRPRSGR